MLVFYPIYVSFPVSPAPIADRLSFCRRYGLGVPFTTLSSVYDACDVAVREGSPSFLGTYRYYIICGSAYPVYRRHARCSSCHPSTLHTTVPLPISDLSLAPTSTTSTATLVLLIPTPIPSALLSQQVTTTSGKILIFSILIRPF